VGEVVDGGGARRRCARPPASARRLGDVAFGRSEGGIGGLLPVAGLRVCCACRDEAWIGLPGRRLVAPWIAVERAPVAGAPGGLLGLAGGGVEIDGCPIARRLPRPEVCGGLSQLVDLSVEIRVASTGGHDEPIVRLQR